MPVTSTTHAVRLLAVMTVVGVLLTLLPTVARAQGSTGHSLTEAWIAHDVFTFINDERVARGEAPLPWSDELAERAAAWSDEMAATGNFAHSSSEFRTPPGWQGTGENIAFGSGGNTASAGHRHAGLMNSQGHRNNILQPGYDAVGIGISCVGGTIYVTEIFGVHPDAPGNDLSNADRPVDPIVHNDPDEGTHCLDTPAEPAPQPSPEFGTPADPPPADPPADPPVEDPPAEDPPGDGSGGDTPVDPDSAGGGSVTVAPRLGQGSPAERAAEVSRLRFPDPDDVGTVVIARVDDVADALAASPYTGIAPLLYTGRDRLPEATAQELRRLLADGGVAVIFGGSGAVAPRVEQDIRALGIDTFRIAGPTRIETALFAAEVIGPSRDGDVAVARAFGAEGNPTAAWADAISVGALAAESGTPVLLTPTDDLHDAVADWLGDARPARTLVLGGEAAILGAVEARLPSPHRLAGAGRDGTAAAINDARRHRVPDLDVVVFNGYDDAGWIDGLLAAGLAADRGATTVMVSADGVPQASRDLLAAGCRTVTVVGTTSLVPDHVIDQVAAACA